MTVFSKHASCREALHPWRSSCSLTTLEIFYHIFRRSFKIYGSLYLIAAIVRRKKLEYFKRFIFPETIQSTVFLSLNGSLFAAGICTMRNLLGQFTTLTAFIPAAFASWIAILAERPSRRGLLALYMFNNAVEVIFNTLVHRNVIKSISYGEVYMFCVATSLLMYLYRAQKLNNAFLNKTSRFLFNERESSNSVSPSSFEDLYRNLDPKILLKRITPTVQAFSVGYIVQSMPNILRNLLRPSRIPNILMHKNNFKLALFFGSFVSIFQSVEFLLKLIRKKQDSVNSLVAGATSGLSLLFYRSSTISLYLFTKVVEMLFKNAQYQGKLPLIPYIDIIIYVLSTATTFHVAVFDCENIRPGYLKFLNHITADRILPALNTFPFMDFSSS